MTTARMLAEQLAASPQATTDPDVPMRPRSSLTLVLLLMSMAMPRAAAAQSPAGWYVGGGAGFGWGTLSLTSDSEVGEASGMVLLGQVGLSRDGRRTWGLQVEAQPFQVPNPLLDERFRTVRASLGRSFFSPFHVTPGIGVEWRSWTGSERAREHETALLLIAGVGRYVPVGPVILLPEVSWSHSPVGRAGVGSSAGVSVRLSVLRLR